MGWDQIPAPAGSSSAGAPDRSAGPSTPATITLLRRTELAAAALVLAACTDDDSAQQALPPPSGAQAAPPALRKALGFRASAQRSPSASELFDWAERSYPQWFAPHSANRLLAPYTYRYYETTGNYLGVSGQDVYLLGPLSGGQLLHVGRLSDFGAQVYPRFTPATRSQAMRFLLQAQVGATDADIDAVLAQGYEGWLQAQFALPLGETAWDWLDQRGYGTVDRHEYYSGGAPAFDFAAFRQFASAPDGLRKRIQLALTEIFVVSLASGGPAWPHFIYATYWDGLGEHAFGNFRSLLEFVTLSAAMGSYLNTSGNLKENPATGRVPDENYAREVMQLFTIGLHQLEADGTPKRDAQGRPIESYSADDVSQLARVFTGYRVDEDGPSFTSVVGNRPVPTHAYSRRAMRFDAEQHSMLEARFLGATVPAGTPGPQALGMALDTLFKHPNVGPFFGRQLIQRLVTSEPSPAYVARVAAAFDDNGVGVRGDMQAVIAAVLLDEEARSEAGLSSPRHGKLREPAVRLLQWARTFGLRSKAGSWKFGIAYGDPAYDFGQRLFWSPSVFNFFRPGFVPPGTALAATGSTAPEFQIVNEASVAQYANALTQLVLDGPWVFAPDRRDNDQAVPSPQSGVGDMVPDYSREIAIAHDPAALLDRLNLLLCAGQLSSATRARLATALDAWPTGTERDRRSRVAQAVLAIMLCPEYLVQK